MTDTNDLYVITPHNGLEAYEAGEWALWRVDDEGDLTIRLENGTTRVISRGWWKEVFTAVPEEGDDET